MCRCIEYASHFAQDCEGGIRAVGNRSRRVGWSSELAARLELRCWWRQAHSRSTGWGSLQWIGVSIRCGLRERTTRRTSCCVWRATIRRLGDERRAPRQTRASADWVALSGGLARAPLGASLKRPLSWHKSQLAHWIDGGNDEGLHGTAGHFRRLDWTAPHRSSVSKNGSPPQRTICRRGSKATQIQAWCMLLYYYEITYKQSFSICYLLHFWTILCCSVLFLRSCVTAI